MPIGKGYKKGKRKSRTTRVPASPGQSRLNRVGTVGGGAKRGARKVLKKVVKRRRK